MPDEHQLMKVRWLPRKSMKNRLDPLGRTTSLNPPTLMQRPTLNRLTLLQQSPQVLVVLVLSTKTTQQTRPLLEPIRLELDRLTANGPKATGD
jgi:hypothetical protein